MDTKSASRKVKLAAMFTLVLMISSLSILISAGGNPSTPTRELTNIDLSIQRQMLDR